MRKIEAIRMHLYFSDKHHFVTQSPEGPVKIGARTKLGWQIIRLGLWLIFGNLKNFRTIFDPLFEENYGKEGEQG